MDFGRDVPRLTRAQADAIRQYDWPGNVRELKNVIERAVILAKGDVLALDIAGTGGTAVSGEPADATSADSPAIMTEDQIRDLQRHNIEAALQKTGWRVSGDNGAARLLGVKPTTLADRIKAYGIRKPHR